MFGQMQDTPLLISSLIDFAAEYHGGTEIVSRAVEGSIHRYTWTDAARRSRQIAAALARLGVGVGDRVATLAWNGYRHVELYFGVSGMGAVLHTINPRLFADQIVYIVEHAADRYVFTDLTFVPLLEKLADKLPAVEGYVIMTDRAHMPETSLPNPLCYEELIEAESGDYAWPSLDERTASSLCYTSGTTGDPKGVLYSHRSTVLHSFAVCAGDGLALSALDAVLPVVPMFHANAWGLIYAAAMCGAKLVLPGAGMAGEQVYELLEGEQVTMSAGVPTVWLMLLDYMSKNGKELPHMNRTVIGGSAAPPSMIEAFEARYGVKVVHAWGMTEMSPLGTAANLTRALAGKPLAETLPYKVKQGRPIYGVEVKVVDDEGKALPRDGASSGHLLVRGPWIVSSYYREDESATDAEHWFDTGDVANLDSEGFMQITDRAKDVIKSGGEWISSIELENLAVGHPEVAEAAVIGVPHPKWSERPLLVIVRAEGSQVSEADILGYLEPKVAKWWLPDAVRFVDELPHTATGKILKTRLREMFEDVTLGEA
ncbi:3-(methylthio)propionyl-CoA ligase [Haliangium sp.]|uniref:3-(methylthio)propionyl-CoA ligase n=1 Tax=Haliangium sp. TaxID=2663208 RepID=UPI003D0F5E0D